MALEEFNENLSTSFIDSEEAFFRLDSIAFAGLEGGLNEEIVKTDLQRMCKIAELYDTQRDKALKVLEKAYCYGLKDRKSQISAYVSLTCHGAECSNPIESLYDKLKEHRHKTLVLHLKMLENMAKDMFDKEEPLHNTFPNSGDSHRVYGQKIKMDQIASDPGNR